MSNLMHLLYFGKLSSRGDFVRSAAHPALIQSLDHWLSSGVELMAEDAHWKQIYDQADSAHFALLSPHRHTAVAGDIVPSADTSGRRFPFLAACAIESEDGPSLTGLAPLMLQRTWRELAEVTRKGRAASDAEAPSVLSEFNQAELAALPTVEDARSQYQRYLDLTTLASFTQDVLSSGVPIDVRQTLLALGLLLQPIMSSPGQSIEKGLFLPLPRDPSTQLLVATFWMDVVSRFLARSSHDLTLFLPRGGQHAPGLMIGFSAGAASVLHGLLDPRATADVFLSLSEAPWVEPYVTHDYALKKLSSYLQLPQMSLAQVLATFQEAFLGS